MSKELKERVMSKAHAAVEGVVNKAHAVVEEIALQVVQDEVESPNMLGIDNARFLYEVGTDTKKCLSGKLPYLLASPPPIPVTKSRTGKDETFSISIRHWIPPHYLATVL